MKRGLSMANLHRVMEWIHLVACLTAAPVPLVLGLTGIFLVFEYPLDHLFNAHVAYVQPAPSAKAQRVTVDAVAVVATQTIPGARLI